MNNTAAKITVTRERKDKALSEAASYGNSVHFWIRDNDPKKAGHLARFAARWAMRAMGEKK